MTKSRHRCHKHYIHGAQALLSAPTSPSPLKVSSFKRERRRHDSFLPIHQVPLPIRLRSVQEGLPWVPQGSPHPSRHGLSPRLGRSATEPKTKTGVRRLSCNTHAVPLTSRARTLCNICGPKDPPLVGECMTL